MKKEAQQNEASYFSHDLLAAALTAGHKQAEQTGTAAEQYQSTGDWCSSRELRFNLGLHVPIGTIDKIDRENAEGTAVECLSEHQRYAVVLHQAEAGLRRRAVPNNAVRLVRVVGCVESGFGEAAEVVTVDRQVTENDGNGPCRWAAARQWIADAGIGCNEQRFKPGS